jgi:hypothetical protein
MLRKSDSEKIKQCDENMDVDIESEESVKCLLCKTMLSQKVQITLFDGKKEVNDEEMNAESLRNSEKENESCCFSGSSSLLPPQTKCENEKERSEQSQVAFSNEVIRSYFVLSCGHACCLTPCADIIRHHVTGKEKGTDGSEHYSQNNDERFFCVQCGNYVTLVKAEQSPADKEKGDEVLMCTVHPHNAITSFCQTHSLLLCPLCASSHTSCLSLTLQEHANRVKGNLSEALLDLERLLALCRKAISERNSPRSNSLLFTTQEAFRVIAEQREKEKNNCNHLVQRRKPYVFVCFFLFFPSLPFPYLSFLLQLSYP